MDRGAWLTTVHTVTESRNRLSMDGSIGISNCWLSGCGWDGGVGMCVCVGVIGYKRSKIVDLVWGNVAHLHTHPAPTPNTHNLVEKITRINHETHRTHREYFY